MKIEVQRHRRHSDGVEQNHHTQVDAGRAPGFADCFGHRAIKRALRERGLKVARAEFANSSLGKIL